MRNSTTSAASPSTPASDLLHERALHAKLTELMHLMQSTEKPDTCYSTDICQRETSPSKARKVAQWAVLTCPLQGSEQPSLLELLASTRTFGTAQRYCAAAASCRRAARRRHRRCFLLICCTSTD